MGLVVLSVVGVHVCSECRRPVPAHLSFPHRGGASPYNESVFFRVSRLCSMLYLFVTFVIQVTCKIGILGVRRTEVLYFTGLLVYVFLSSV